MVLSNVINDVAISRREKRYSDIDNNNVEHHLPTSSFHYLLLFNKSIDINWYNNQN